jgi:hypothetical protein
MLEREVILRKKEERSKIEAREKERLWNRGRERIREEETRS